MIMMMVMMIHDADDADDNNRPTPGADKEKAGPAAARDWCFLFIAAGETREGNKKRCQDGPAIRRNELRKRWVARGIKGKSIG